MNKDRFQVLKQVLAKRQSTLTVLMENVHKPHNYAAVLRSCDAVGVLQAHAISSERVVASHPSTSASAHKWVDVQVHTDIVAACHSLHAARFRIYAAHLNASAKDFRTIDYTQPVAVLLGAEKFGVSDEALALVDGCIVIPMQGMVESLNVSVANAVILFEAQRQRQAAGLYQKPELRPDVFASRLFEWAYPKIAALCRRRNVPYPALDDEGTIIGELPR